MFHNLHSTQTDHMQPELSSTNFTPQSDLFRHNSPNSLLYIILYHTVPLYNTLQVKRFADQICHSPFVCVDGNIPVETIEFVCNLCCEGKVPGTVMLITVLAR